MYIVLAPLYLKSVRKLQEKRFVFVKILAIIIPENGAKVSKIKCFQFAQQTLIKDLLILAASDSKKWHLTLGNHDSDTLLLDVYETFEPVCRHNGITLNLMLPDMELPRIHCDKSRVIQILTILLDNAITYTLPDGMIDLEIFIKKRNVCYLVADHGNGIPDEEKERIFDRFYQSDKSRKEKEHFGLGLSIARELTELQKGKLTLTDTPGGGCTFCLMLPAAEEGNVT